MAACLFADNTVMLTESETDLQRVVDEFSNVCRRTGLKVNAGKSKVMVFERKEVEVCSFITPYKVRVPPVTSCKIVLGGERMEEVKEF